MMCVGRKNTSTRKEGRFLNGLLNGAVVPNCNGKAPVVYLFLTPESVLKF